MATSNSPSSATGSLSGLVFIVFLTLKLCGVIDWSWWWVTAPLWGWAALALIVVWITAIVACFAAERIFLGSLLTAITVVGSIWAGVVIF